MIKSFEERKKDRKTQKKKIMKSYELMNILHFLSDF